ncbi:MAG: hypothetical protein BGO01_19245 [Armatimonadetes bacterium 55-13]|nr:PEP-CTERM sorting domain-containing protein [Armatimonadota bacterium]OJU64256.1 MAG: hypothetical protein BGO01_19245 [Armatimonadetes bacterium 55-13]
MKRIALIGVGSLSLISAAMAQVSYSGGTYSQDFNTLAMTGTSNTWTDNSTLLGWYANKTTYIADSGTSTTGGVHSYGSASTDNERALGSVGSNSAGDMIYGANFVNLMGGDADFFVLQYTGEQWRNGGNATAQKLSFAYSLDATSLTTGTWTSVTSLDFTGPIHTTTAGALNGNAAANRTTLNDMVNLSSVWTAGSSLWIKWTDLNDSGNDHALAIDDVTFTSRANPVPEPASMAALGLGALGLIRRRRNKK